VKNKNRKAEGNIRYEIARRGKGGIQGGVGER
jgi:hypothetical protein